MVLFIERTDHNERFSAQKYELVVRWQRKNEVFLSLRHKNASLFQFGPSVGGPGDWALNEKGGTVAGGAVTVADEDVLTVDVVGGAVASGFPLLLVAF